MDETDDVLDALRALGAIFVKTLPDLPKRERTSRFVNGRGQLLESPCRMLPDPSTAILTLLFSPDRPREVDAALNALGREQSVVDNVHRCLNDGGAAYHQAFDIDVAALKQYLLGPLLDSIPVRLLTNDLRLGHLGRPCGASRGSAPERGRWPHADDPGARCSPRDPVGFASGVTVRPATDEERIEWAEDASFERSIARDILKAECIVEVSYASRWGGARHTPETGINVATFDADGVADALDLSSRAIAVMRLVTGRSLPLVFTQDQIHAIPWARNRFFHRPTINDTIRRFDHSPLWVRVVDAEPLGAAEFAKLTQMWDAVGTGARTQPDVLRAVRLACCTSATTSTSTGSST